MPAHQPPQTDTTTASLLAVVWMLFRQVMAAWLSGRAFDAERLLEEAEQRAEDAIWRGACLASNRPDLLNVPREFRAELMELARQRQALMNPRSQRANGKLPTSPRRRHRFRPCARFKAMAVIMFTHHRKYRAARHRRGYAPWRASLCLWLADASVARLAARPHESG